MQNGKDYRPITDLHEWKDNPRSITKSGFERLKKQIQKLGQYKPLLITSDGEVLGGNMRLKAYRELGITDVWVSVVEPKDDNEKLEYALSDNDRAGFYDDDLLANLVPNYDIDWSAYAVDLKEPTNIKDLLDQFIEVQEDEAPEVSNEPAISQLGEVYQLGRHRLMCGDSTSIEQVEQLMNGQKADMVFTDPLYGVDFAGAKYNPRAKHWDGILNDKKQGEALYEFIAQVFANVVAVSQPASPVYVWSPPMQEGYEILRGVQSVGIHVQSQLIWRKNTIVLGQADYQWKHEVCWYGWTEGKHHFWNGGRDLATVWEFSKDSNQSYQHPTQKPVGLSKNAIANSCRQDGLVLDVFGGSGSTMMGAEQTNRTCYMMELDPKYCDVIRKRYAKFVGKEAEWQTLTPKI